MQGTDDEKAMSSAQVTRYERFAVAMILIVRRVQLLLYRVAGSAQGSIQPTRAPADPSALQQLLARLGARHAAALPASKGRTADSKTPTPPRISRESLAMMASSDPRATCGCQRNLVDVVLSLRALEDYLNGCDSRSPEDADLHRALWSKVGDARSSIEDAIEHFAAVEGIEL